MGVDESDSSSFEFTFLEESLVLAISKGMRKHQSQKKDGKKLQGAELSLWKRDSRRPTKYLHNKKELL